MQRPVSVHNQERNKTTPHSVADHEAGNRLYDTLVLFLVIVLLAATLLVGPLVAMIALQGGMRW
ncbi:MAG: hypothetical protein HC828_21705 [Blastochloris sp.]|nr:hypothetical protein [Blastochloris sp.]